MGVTAPPRERNIQFMLLKGNGHFTINITNQWHILSNSCVITVEVSLELFFSLSTNLMQSQTNNVLLFLSNTSSLVPTADF